MIEEEDEEEEKEEEDEVDKKEKPAGPSPIHDMFYENGDPNKFWVSMGGYDAGYMYNCSLEGATNSNDNYESSLSIPVPAFNGIDIPLHCMKFRLVHCKFILKVFHDYLDLRKMLITLFWND